MKTCCLQRFIIYQGVLTVSEHVSFDIRSFYVVNALPFGMPSRNNIGWEGITMLEEKLWGYSFAYS